ncbi:MAG TPA: FecR domain-containing protein [Candidatus Limnocylindria bacterium]|nr:FecR domain-containing protein [Candidatus Limnocylindria bacterium]
MGKGWGRRRLLIAAVIAALVVLPAALVITQQRAAASATILSILDGTVSVARGTAAFAAAADGDIVNTGDRVQTAAQSHAMVTFFDGSTLEIEPATTVQIEEAASVNGATLIGISQTLGRTWASVQKLTRADSKFEVRTPTLTAAVRGTGFITDVLADGTSTVRTADGTVQVTAQGQSVIVNAGQTTTAAPNSPPTAPVSTPANRLRFGMHSPAYLVVMDSSGRACGVVLPGPNVVRQIPGCLASDPGTDPQLVDVPDAPTGTYRLFVTSIAPGGAFVASASAVDAFGALSFNYTASGSGQPGAKFATSIDVATGPRGALTASGLGPLTVVERAPVKFVRGPQVPLPVASGPPDAAAFPPLPGLGFTAGTNITPTPTPSASPTALPSATVSPSPSPAATPTPGPTSSPPTATAAPTFVPTAPPTAPPTTAPTLPPTIPPTPTPTPQPTPTPMPPTLSGGSASAGGTLPVLGTNWTVGATITIRWPDGTQIGSADVQADGRFATIIRIPQGAVAGMTYKITASGGGLTQTADVAIVVVYTPTFTLNNTFPPRAGTQVPYSGGGWPPSSSYVIRFGVTQVASASTSPTGAMSGSFTVPANTPPGTYTITAASGIYTATAQLTTQ